MEEMQRRKDRNCDRKGNACKNIFEQQLCVEFEVTFVVDIEDVDILDVSCPG